MGRRLAQGSDERFAAYVEEIASVIGHADRVGPGEAYCIGQSNAGRLSNGKLFHACAQEYTIDLIRRAAPSLCLANAMGH